MSDPIRSELGDFLRSRREKLSPQGVGLSSGRRRRTPGLRREEVAELAGIGVDWYIRLEQGRAVTPSVTTVDALAGALRLGKVEHAHLRALARNHDRGAFTRETVPDAIRRLVESLDQPAYVTGRRWDVLAWNAAAAEGEDVAILLGETAEIGEDLARDRSRPVTLRSASEGARSAIGFASPLLPRGRLLGPGRRRPCPDAPGGRGHPARRG